MERWKQISDFPDYWVSSYGRVRSHKRGERLILKQGKDGHGYPQVCLHNKGVPKTQLVHIMVLAAFRGKKPGPRYEGCHEDNIPTNNHLYNLRWGTRKSNVFDRRRQGTHISGERVWTAKLTKANVLEIRSSSEAQIVLAKRFGVNPSTICGIKARRTWKEV